MPIFILDIYNIKAKINLVDLYKIEEGLYYYNRGWNYKAIIILFGTSIFPFVGKFITPLKIFYDNSYVLGLFIAMLIYLLVLKISINAKKERGV